MSVNARNVYDMDAAIAEFYDLSETKTKDVEMIRGLLHGCGKLYACFAKHGCAVEWTAGGNDRAYTSDAPRATLWARRQP